MSATTGLPLTVQLDVALDHLQRRRDAVLTDVGDPDRALRVAELYEVEARLWSTLFEHAEVRLIWRAALAAESHARLWARQWRRRAAAQCELAAASLAGSDEDGAV